MLDTSQLPESPAIVEVARIADIPWKDGSIVVAVKDAGNGPAIDVRELLPAKDGYQLRNGGAVTSKPPRFTRRGFWMPAHTAELLIDALAAAVVAALEVSHDG